jgi:hypothetical protein
MLHGWLVSVIVYRLSRGSDDKQADNNERADSQ